MSTLSLQQRDAARNRLGIIELMFYPFVVFIQYLFGGDSVDPAVDAELLLQKINQAIGQLNGLIGRRENRIKALRTSSLTFVGDNRDLRVRDNAKKIVKQRGKITFELGLISDLEDIREDVSNRILAENVDEIVGMLNGQKVNSTSSVFARLSAKVSEINSRYEAENVSEDVYDANDIDGEEVDRIVNEIEQERAKRQATIATPSNIDCQTTVEKLDPAERVKAIKEKLDRLP